MWLCWTIEIFQLEEGLVYSSKFQNQITTNFPEIPISDACLSGLGLEQLSLLPTRESFKRAIVAGIPNPFVKILH